MQKIEIAADSARSTRTQMLKFGRIGRIGTVKFSKSGKNGNVSPAAAPGSSLAKSVSVIENMKIGRIGRNAQQSVVRVSVNPAPSAKPRNASRRSNQPTCAMPQHIGKSDAADERANHRSHVSSTLVTARPPPSARHSVPRRTPAPNRRARAPGDPPRDARVHVHQTRSPPAASSESVAAPHDR